MFIYVIDEVGGAEMVLTIFVITSKSSLSTEECVGVVRRD